MWTSYFIIFNRSWQNSTHRRNIWEQLSNNNFHIQIFRLLKYHPIEPGTILHNCEENLKTIEKVDLENSWLLYFISSTLTCWTDLLIYQELFQGINISLHLSCPVGRSWQRLYNGLPNKWVKLFEECGVWPFRLRCWDALTPLSCKHSECKHILQEYQGLTWDGLNNGKNYQWEGTFMTSDLCKNALIRLPASNCNISTFFSREIVNIYKPIEM